MTQRQDPEVIDVDKLERELVTALEADRKYSRENDAKFRAVHQKVATYEEFRDIVKASHLTCLDREDITGKKERKQPWNPVASSGVPCCHGDLTVPLTSTGAGGTPMHAQPSTIQEFLKEWRKLRSVSPEEQYTYLLSIGGHQLRSLFKVEISMGLLGEFLTVLNLCINDSDGAAIVEMLKQLSTCSRFKLALDFLGKDEKRAAQQLLDKLKEAMDNVMDNVNSVPATDHLNTRTACLQELAELYTNR